MNSLLPCAIALACLTGCAVWEEDVKASAFERCSDMSEPDARRTCVSEVRAAAAASRENEIRMRQQREEDEEARALARKVYGTTYVPD